MKFNAHPIAAAAFGFTATAVVSMNSTAAAQSCNLLEVVGGDEGTEVTKTVSPPSALVVDSNWNTDFVVPSGRDYSYFIVNFMSERGESYDVDVNLKYPDDTVDSAYSVRDGDFPEGEALTIRAETRRSSTPFQVNLRVGGINAIDNTYTASVAGCR